MTPEAEAVATVKESLTTAEPHFMDTPEWREHFARILAEIAADTEIAVGHCGSYT